MTSFFAEGTPVAPGAALSHYKTRAATAPPRATWRAEVANLPLLSRAVSELSARGGEGLVVVLPAADRSDDQTEVADEGALVPTLRRLVRKAPAGFRLDLALSVGRPYVLPPPSLDVSTHDRCGLRCAMCNNRSARPDPARMAEDEVAALIREAAAWGVPRVALTGAGEPFRDPTVPRHLALADALGLLATVTCNGLLVTEALAATLAGLHASISVSIHGATDATHEAITGVPGSGKGAWRAIERLVAARERAGSRGRFSVNVSTVLQRANVDEIAALVRRSREAGCDGHNLQPLNLQHGRFAAGGAGIERADDAAAAAVLWPTPAQDAALDALFDELVAFRRAHGHLRTSEERLGLFRRYLRDPSREALGVTCRVGTSFLGVDHRGALKPCYRVPWKLGDARALSVRRLWNSAAYARVRAQVEACPLVCLNNCFFRT